MKRVILSLFFLATASLSFAQNAKVTTAGNYLKQGDLIKAKTAIDEASVHEKTQGKPNMLVYKGKIYLAIAVDTTDETAPYRKEAIFVSSQAYQEATKVADSRTDLIDVKKDLYIFVYNKMWDDGVVYYNSKDFANASKNFEGCAQIREFYNELDTLGYYYAANAASAAEDHALAITYFNKIKDSGYQDGAIYAKLASQYKILGDTAKAMEVLGQGRVAYPNNQDLLISEFNLYVEMGETEKAIANIDKAIEANPEKSSYYFVRGKLQESLGNLSGAEADYKKALEVDPNNLDANHDLGALYVNQSIKVVEEMNNLPLSATKEYDAKKKELDSIYAKALPYLEKAYALDPSDKEVQGILMKLYLRQSDTEKYNKIKADIDKAATE